MELFNLTTRMTLRRFPIDERLQQEEQLVPEAHDPQNHSSGQSWYRQRAVDAGKMLTAAAAA